MGSRAALNGTGPINRHSVPSLCSQGKHWSSLGNAPPPLCSSAEAGSSAPETQTSAGTLSSAWCLFATSNQDGQDLQASHLKECGSMAR